MAYSKFHCACGQCDEMVQVEGAVHRGHRAALKEANIAKQFATIDELIKGFGAAKPDETKPTTDVPDTSIDPPGNTPPPDFDPPLPEPPAVDPDGPPPYPAPIDQRLWRLAEERPNTPKTNPWLKTICHNCREPMWTRDPKATWEHGGLCQYCVYTLMSEFYDRRGQQVRQQARTFIDPFRVRT